VAAASALFGAAFVVVAWHLAAELLRLGGARDAEPTVEPLPRALVTAALVTQGYVQLFFGYVETYSVGALAIAIYLLVALRYLRHAAPLLAPLLVLAVAGTLHLSTLTLAPSALVLVGVGLADSSRRREAVWAVVVGALAVAALAVAFQWYDARFSLLAHLGQLHRQGRGSAGYLFSQVHVRDFLSEHALIGPYGLLLAAPAALFAAALGRWRDSRCVFLMGVGLAAAVACWMVPDLPLGYARDWDLFAPLGAAMTVAGVGLLARLAGEGVALRRALALLVAASLFHTVPWVLVNASEQRALERFTFLPLGLGRTESTVAYWYARRGDHEAARYWLAKSLNENPSNTRAHELFGQIAMAEGDSRGAVLAFESATRIRPERYDYRLQLVDALARNERPGEALAHLDTLLARRPEAAELWHRRGGILQAMGRAEEAAAALRKAEGLLRARREGR
jgi:hypothetical protein